MSCEQARITSQHTYRAVGAEHGDEANTRRLPKPHADAVVALHACTYGVSIHASNKLGAERERTELVVVRKLPSLQFLPRGLSGLVHVPRKQVPGS